MRYQPRFARRRPILWSQIAVARLLRAEQPELADAELDVQARELTRQLNALDDRLRYNDWKFRERHRLAGMRVDELDELADFSD